MLFQGKKDEHLKNIANEHRVINVISTDLQKAGRNMFHSYEDADIDIKKLVAQSSLK